MNGCFLWHVCGRIRVRGDSLTWRVSCRRGWTVPPLSSPSGSEASPLSVRFACVGSWCWSKSQDSFPESACDTKGCGLLAHYKKAERKQFITWVAHVIKCTLCFHCPTLMDVLYLINEEGKAAYSHFSDVAWKGQLACTCKYCMLFSPSFCECLSLSQYLTGTGISYFQFCSTTTKQKRKD